ncbi:signal peptidase II [Ketogulonicigenium vulgare]|uniref:Lipoprotein signal peptidase n=1 Tax=Ketogulonicigenium vulgare (strain WSH-001) TaxID=759362 RepID=F9Y4D2_KETVW|nr:signal peptidase II [Ketogulonicigenium vulgare]ADO43463.1 lipoprotein signal peptidase [Ketogulonicigenium vulgare Y25]AEM41745.1 Signal peptidase II [Ketogulonicigenium vulgare WSH-001]ALJ81853.1 lipoprotein signal peptidase [Ketogulonicigenium vulgare]ANW34506.1 signal peptidase II [Ketogulonicigenium vulgare]AOZ55499.1 lipoprotein signal peptidase [Ketogulonicigenium vulgare]
MRLVLWSAFWVFVVDQVSKYLILHRMNLIWHGSIDIWPPYLRLRMAWNQGVNFGLFHGMDLKWLLIAVAIVISGVVLWWMRRGDEKPLARVSAGILVGGAIGNVVDRLIYGAVADFLNMSFPGFDNPYAFNVADIAIFAGAAGLILFSGGASRDPKQGDKQGVTGQGQSGKRPAKTVVAKDKGRK